MIHDAETFSHDNKAKLIRMAREIAEYFHAYPQDKAVASIAEHINHFWTPKMREDFLAAASEPGISLPPLVEAARGGIKRKKIE
jgi:formate dehydrogenase subunit delta